MRGRRFVSGVLLCCVLAIAGCGSPSNIKYIPEGDAYTAGELALALESSDPGASAGVSVGDAYDVRQDALTALRGYGTEAAALADTLTAEFPAELAAVPYQVELGTFEGEPAWLVFESWGEGSTELAYRRLWVLSYDTRAVLAAQSTR